jgi:hypothetical protein
VRILERSSKTRKSSTAYTDNYQFSRKTVLSLKAGSVQFKCCKEEFVLVSKVPEAV